MKSTSVKLTVLACHANIVSTSYILRDVKEAALSNIKQIRQDHEDLTVFYVDVAPYGVMIDIPSMEADGIAYTLEKSDPHCRDYSKDSLRFSASGEMQRRQEGYRDRWISDESLHDWIARHGTFDSHLFVDICRHVLQEDAKYYDPLPWTNQDRNGKRYRTKRLLTNGNTRTEQGPG